MTDKVANTLRQTTTVASLTNIIRARNVRCNINTLQMPCFRSFPKFQETAQAQSEELVHDLSLSFNIAHREITTGYSQCLWSSPPELSQYRTICDTYETLCVDIMNMQSIDKIFTKKKSRKFTRG